MGAELVKLYEQGEQKGGISGGITMALVTKMSKEQALSNPDSPENIKLFQDALAQVK